MPFDLFKRPAPRNGARPKDTGTMMRDAAEPRARRHAPRESCDGELIVQRRHVDWLEHQIRWRWLMDSLEGGDRYRNAIYGMDRRGLPCRNLFRHKREYPDPQQLAPAHQGLAGYLGAGDGSLSESTGGPFPGMVGADPAATAMDDDYELRRARTPIPEFVAEAIEIHLAKIYDQEVSRSGSQVLTAWWKNVDGCGTPIDDYMRETIAPLLLVLGCIDICLDHPQAPPGAVIKTRADELRFGLDQVVASYVLPMNMVWWRTDPAGRYLECLVREYVDPADRIDHDENGSSIDPENSGAAAEQWRNDYVHWRLWTCTESILFNFDGSEVINRVAHNFGRVPIVRLIDLKKHRTRTVGKSRYEAIAEYQREFYNRDSELILSDTLQAHPFLSGPEDYCKADNTLSVGPGYLLPKKKNPENGSYEGFDYVSPPKDPAESLRRNKDDLIDLKDRRACLSKPAGSGSSGTVGQSGLSKQIDAHTGHKLLTSIARSLAKAERLLAEYALTVIRDRPPTPADRDEIKVCYPSRFDLRDASELIEGTAKLQLVLEACGNAPNTERELIQATIRQLLLGLDDGEYKLLDDEIETLVKLKSRLKERPRELPSATIESHAEAHRRTGKHRARGRQGSGRTERQISHIKIIGLVVRHVVSSDVATLCTLNRQPVSSEPRADETSTGSKRSLNNGG